jgi:hypothetical protein
MNSFFLSTAFCLLPSIGLVVPESCSFPTYHLLTTCFFNNIPALNS